MNMIEKLYKNKDALNHHNFIKEFEKILRNNCFHKIVEKITKSVTNSIKNKSTNTKELEIIKEMHDKLLDIYDKNLKKQKEYEKTIKKTHHMLNVMRESNKFDKNTIQRYEKVIANDIKFKLPNTPKKIAKTNKH